MKFKSQYLIGIAAAVFLIVLDILFVYNNPPLKRWFYAFLVLAISVGWAQFWYDFFKESKRQKDIELKFLEFVRALVGTVKSGISVPQAIIHAAKKDYGALTPYTSKLSNQLEWGIPVHEALITFANDTKNSVIKRSVAIVIEAEQSGGDMEDVLESVTNSVVEVKKIKAERKSSTYSQIVQGYIVFFVFIGIMLLLQIKLFPLLSNVSGSMTEGLAASGLAGGLFGSSGQDINMDRLFFSLIMIQAFFAGIMVGKFSEGTVKQGLLHSLILMTISALIVTTAKGGI
ncbi:MAG: type II secretion system F family protein [Candidatus Nanoarchaeia archaeon]